MHNLLLAWYFKACNEEYNNVWVKTIMCLRGGALQQYMRQWKGYWCPVLLVDFQERFSLDSHSFGRLVEKLDLMVFSLFGLNGVIASPDNKCWRIFVKLCTLLCTPLISLEDLEKAHAYVIQFCQTFQTLYGEPAVTQTCICTAFSRIVYWTWVLFMAFGF